MGVILGDDCREMFSDIVHKVTLAVGVQPTKEKKFVCDGWNGEENMFSCLHRGGSEQATLNAHLGPSSFR